MIAEKASALLTQARVIFTYAAGCRRRNVYESVKKYICRVPEPVEKMF